MGRKLRRFLKSEQLESRRPLAADLAALDVNDDLSVTALDALIVINEINQRSAGVVTVAEAEGQLDCDTNDDGVVTPIDVLNVVNQINTGFIAVPTDNTDTTTEETANDDVSVPTDENTSVDENDGTTPDDNTTDDSDSTDSGDNTSDDSSDPSNQDETDGDDDDVVTDPSDDTSDDTSEDEPTEDDTSDDSSDDDSSDDQSGTDGETDCEREHPAGGQMRRVLLGGLRGRGDLFAHWDANGDGALTSDEVPEGLWDRLLPADGDANDSVTKAELQAYREAQRVAAVEAFFEQLDRDASGSITSADVSRMTWRFLSRADANNDGGVTLEELLAVPLPFRMGH